MYIENRELIEAVVKNLSDEYQPTRASLRNQLSRDELISKLIIAESTIQIIKEKVKVLERETHVWNSSDGLKVTK